MQSSPNIYDWTKLKVESDSLFLKNGKSSLSHQKSTLTDTSFLSKQHQQLLSSENKQREQQQLNNSNMHLYQTGRWSHEENRQFIEALFIYGTDWKQVQSYIKTRTSIQSRSHAQKFFINFNKKYIEAYGANIDNSESNIPIILPSKKILTILSKMHHCDFIAKLCGNINHIFHGDYIKKVFDKFKQTDKESHQYNLNPLMMKKFIEEKKDNFIKAICGLMQVSSRTKNNSTQRIERVEINKFNSFNQNSESSIKKDCDIDAAHRYEDNRNNPKTLNAPYSEDSNETNGTAQNGFESQLNMGLTIEDLFNFGSIEESDFNEGKYVNHLFNSDLPYYFGQSN